MLDDQTDLQVEILEQGTSNTITEYVAGQTYDVLVTINTAMGTPAGYGFQIVSLEAGNNTPINTWANPANNVQLATLNNGRQYAEHNGISSTNTFSMEWTAPSSGSDITFYAAGNAVNGNSSTSGDGSDVKQVTISEFVNQVVTADAATNVIATDIADNGDGSDIQVQFTGAANETGIFEYRVYVVKASNAANFDVTAAQAANDFTTVMTQGNSFSYSIMLAGNAQDVDGDLITNNTDYTIFVMSEPDGVDANLPSLSSGSNTFTLIDVTSTRSVLADEANIYNISEQIVIDFPSLSKYQSISTQLFHINGQLIRQQNITNHNTAISTLNLTKGFYFIQLRADNEVWTKQLVID